MPKDVLQIMQHLPDPRMGIDDHHLLFEEIFAMNTSEKVHPSLSNANKERTLLFIPTRRHVKNVNVMVQCKQYELWRLLYSKRKLPLQKQ